MKNSKLLLLAVPLVLAACVAEEPADDTAMADIDAPAGDMMPPPAMDTGMMMAGGEMAGMGSQIAINAVNNSGVSGNVELTPEGNQTRVMVNLVGAPSGEHKGHIHEGTCANLGTVVQPLEDIDASGSSTTTVNIPAATVMNGQHVIAYHVAGGDPGQPIACADIPSKAM